MLLRGVSVELVTLLREVRCYDLYLLILYMERDWVGTIAEECVVMGAGKEGGRFKRRAREKNYSDLWMMREWGGMEGS